MKTRSARGDTNMKTYVFVKFIVICFLAEGPFHMSDKVTILTFDSYLIHWPHFFNIVRLLKKHSLFWKLFYRLKQKYFTKCIYLQRRSFLILCKIKEIPLRTSWPPKEARGLSMLYEEADPDSSQSSLLMQNLKFSVPLGRPQEMLKSKAGQRRHW